MENVVYEPQNTSTAGDPPIGTRPGPDHRQERAANVSLSGPVHRLLRPVTNEPRLRRRVLRLALVLVASVVLPLAGSSSAFATSGYALGGQFGGGGAGDGQFLFGPQALAVMQSSGEVFATDAYNTPARVQRFDASGTFVSSFSLPEGYTSPGPLATDSSGGGSVYVSAADSSFGGAVVKVSPAGVFQHALDVGASGVAIKYGTRVAVDPVDGTVFVAATNGSGMPVVATFDGSTGAYVSSFDGSSGSPDGGFSSVDGLAVDAAHRLYVLDNTKSRVDRYAVDGTFGAIVDDGSRGTPTYVAVDPVSGEPFVAAGTQVTKFTAGGADRGQSFGGSSLLSVSGLAVGHDADTVYVGDFFASSVVRFAPFDGPTVTTTTSTPIDATSQTLNGTIDPEGESATYHFEYGTTATYGSQSAVSEPVTGTDPLPATGTATGLTPNTTYHFRIVGSNATGSIVGEDQTFTTAAVPPLLDGSPAFASMITTSGATLNGTLNPNGSATTYAFEYGTTTAYGSRSESAVSSAGFSDEPVSVNLNGLAAGTTYHYRLVADNGTGGEQQGADGVFHTAPATPVTATDVGVYGATLHGVINPHGASTTYRFEYGTSTAYGQSTAEVDVGSGDGEQPVTQILGNLSPDTVYHFRVVATTNGVTASSDDRTFATGSVPLVTAGAATGISLNAATVHGTVDTHGKDGTYQFAIDAVDRSYGRVTEPRALSSTEPMPVSATLDDLPHGTRFRVTLSITSNGATVKSDQVVFSTPALQLVPPRVPFDPSNPVTAYGCAAPVLKSFDAHPRPGDTITVAGSDLGDGGTIALGNERTVGRWGPGGLTVQVPDDVRGTLPLTVNCGRVSNTIAVVIYEEPSNGFSVTKTSVKGTTATITLRLPGVGKVQTSAKRTKATTKTITKAGTVKVQVKLSSAGRKALKKAKARKVNVEALIRFTPAGGTTANETVSLTYKRKAGR